MSGYMQLAAASALGLFATASFAGETIDFTYDKKGRVTGVTHTGGPANGVSASYTYDDAQNRTNVTVTVPGAPLRRRQSFSSVPEAE